MSLQSCDARQRRNTCPQSLRFSEPKEQERAESAILSLVSLVRDDYTAIQMNKRSFVAYTHLAQLQPFSLCVAYCIITVDACFRWVNE